MLVCPICPKLECFYVDFCSDITQRGIDASGMKHLEVAKCANVKDFTLGKIKLKVSAGKSLLEA